MARSYTEPATIEIGNPCGLTPLDLATASMLGQDRCGPLPHFPRDVSLEETLWDLIEPALVSGRCFVSFSGGRESSLVLAAATAAARSRGHPDPIPATLRYPLAPAVKDVECQERVIAHLGLKDWERLEIRDEFSLLGPYARRALHEVGILFPTTAYVLLPMLDLAKGGWLLVGGGWTDFFAYWHLSRLAEVLARRRRPRRRDVRLLAATALPRPMRTALLRSRVHQPSMPWLREEPALEAERLLRSELAAVPLRFDTALARQRTRRCYAGTQAGLDTLAASSGARLQMPFRTDEYLGAAAAAGGRWGATDRLAAMRLVAGHLLPDEVLRRPDAPPMRGLLFGEGVRFFVEHWAGDGVDTEVTDPDVLREIWSHDAPDWKSSMLLQLAFSHQERKNEREPVGHVLTGAGERRESDLLTT